MKSHFDIKHHLSLWIAFVVAVMGYACADGDKFTVRGSIDGDPTGNLRLVYYDRDALQTALTVSNQGKFECIIPLTTPAILEIYDNDYRLLGRCLAEPGNKVDCRLMPSNPYLSTFEGTEVNQRLTEFYNANARALLGADANSEIAEYVGQHRSDPVATVLLAGSFNSRNDGCLCDSLVRMLEGEALLPGMAEMLRLATLVPGQAGRPSRVVPVTFIDRRDSLVSYNPRRQYLSLITVTDQQSGRDSLIKILRALRRDYSVKQLAIIDYSVDADTLTWKVSTRRDTATWTQTWGPGSLSAPALHKLAVPTVPFYIVADSVGTQLYRGKDLNEARQLIDRHFR